MPKAKEIICHCHGLIGLSPDYKSPWEDVWISFKGKPGRKRYRFGPCLCSRANAESDLEFSRRMQEKHPEDDYSKEIGYAQTALEVLKTQERFVSREWNMFERRIPQIYTRADTINRAEAERMLDAYLVELGVTGPKKFKWKRPRFVAIPVSV